MLTSPGSRHQETKCSGGCTLQKRILTETEGWGRTVNLEEDWPWEEYDEMFCRPDTERYGGKMGPIRWFRRMTGTGHNWLIPSQEEQFWRKYLDERLS